MKPVGGNMLSAYDFYSKPKLPPGQKKLMRKDTMPPCTTLTEVFTGTIDHIFYNKESVKLLGLLEIPDSLDMEDAMPNLT